MKDFNPVFSTVLGEEWKTQNLLSTNATTWTNGEGLRGFFVVSRELLIAKPAFRGEDVSIYEVDAAAVSHVSAELHIGLC